jgi:hypothetical protein
MSTARAALNLDQLCINTMRTLAIGAVQEANSISRNCLLTNPTAATALVRASRMAVARRFTHDFQMVARDSKEFGNGSV